MRATGLAIAALAALALAAPPAAADGGVVRAREGRGDLTITLFTAPTPLRAGDADVSVLVQDRASGRPVLDATVAVRLEPAGDTRPPLVVPLTHAAATNKLLQAATVRFPEPGRYRLVATVRRGAAREEVAAEVAVAPPLPALLALWPYLALPPVVVTIFLVQQWLRRRSSRAVRGDAGAPRARSVAR
jgi:hypothetical protein